jgi:hypothetical protein
MKAKVLHGIGERLPREMRGSYLRLVSEDEYGKAPSLLETGFTP